MGVSCNMRIQVSDPSSRKRTPNASVTNWDLPAFNHRILNWVIKMDDQRADDRICYTRAKVYFWGGRGSGSSYDWRAPSDGVTVWSGVTTIAWEAYCFAVKTPGSHLFLFTATPVLSHSRMAAILGVFFSLVRAVCRGNESQHLTFKRRNAICFI